MLITTAQTVYDCSLRAVLDLNVQKHMRKHQADLELPYQSSNSS